MHRRAISLQLTGVDSDQSIGQARSYTPVTPDKLSN